jgi:phosphopantetheinyl transferase
MKTWIQSDFKFKRGWQAGHTLEKICQTFLFRVYGFNFFFLSLSLSLSLSKESNYYDMFTLGYCQKESSHKALGYPWPNSSIALIQVG